MEDRSLSRSDFLRTTQGRRCAPARINDPTVEAALPLGARRLLAGLLEDRALGRESHRLVQTWASRLAVAPGTIRRWLTSLRKAGFEMYCGRQWREVAHRPLSALEGPAAMRRGPIHQHRLVPVRLAIADVRGGVVQATPKARAWAEREALRRVRAARGWGGPRPGSGRPRKEQTVVKSEKLAQILVSPDRGSLVSAKPEDASRLPGRGASFSEVAPKPTLGALRAPDPGKVDRLRALGGDVLPPAPSLVEVPIPAGLGDRQAALTLTRRLKGGELPYVTQPTPALAPADPLAAAEALAAAYRGVVEQRTGRRSFFRVTPRWRARLEAAAALMAPGEPDETGWCTPGVPPSAWVLFSADVWAVKHGRGKPPPPAWVFAVSRLRDPAVREWFDDAAAAYRSGRRALLAPEAAALAADHAAMWRDLLRENPADRLSVRAVVARWFPGDAWDRRVLEARAAQVRVAREAHEAAEKGACLWV